MDRVGAVTWSERASKSRGPSDEFVLPSRVNAIAGIASALHAGRGPALLTGEPGVGKTWACQRLRDVMPTGWRWAAIDISPSISEAELLQLILHALGCDKAVGPADARTAITDTLTDGAEDGELWALVVDEAHNATLGILEELRILGNRMGERGAFAGLVLAGQSALARRLTTRPLASYQARISARIHLRPLDLDELRTWLAQLEPGRTWDSTLVEGLHQETTGNPRKILARPLRRTGELAARAQPVPARVSAPPTMTAAKLDHAGAERRSDWDAAPVGPGKPPIQIGEGMIEVGWEPSEAPEQGDDSGTVRDSPTLIASPLSVINVSTRTPSTGTGVAEEVIDDHYAALQAWTEWAQNQGRQPVESVEPLSGFAGDPLTDLDPDENPAARISGNPGVRVEGQQEFAPYSQLFSRLRQGLDSQ